MKTKLSVLAFLIFVSCIAAVSQVNLLKNGDFEQSPIDGTKVRNFWTAGWYPQNAGAITTNDSRKGECGLWIYTDTGNSNVNVYQTVGCTPDTQYQATAFFRCPEDRTWTPGSEAWISVEFRDNDGIIIGEPLNSAKMTTHQVAWKQFSIPVRSPQNASKVTFRIKLTSGKGQSILNVDDCSIVKMQ